MNKLSPIVVLIALIGFLAGPSSAEPSSQTQYLAQRTRKQKLGNRLDEFARIIGRSEQQIRLLADMDGDGIRDQIFLVKLLRTPTAGITVKTLASETNEAPRRGTRALAIVLNPGAQAEYFIFVSKDGFPLEGPSWNTDDFTGFVSIGTGPEPPQDAKGASINIVTESGAGWYIHYNGTSFVDSSQGDMP